jgi:hypothetical protein
MAPLALTDAQEFALRTLAAAARGRHGWQGLRVSNVTTPADHHYPTVHSGAIHKLISAGLARRFPNNDSAVNAVITLAGLEWLAANVPGEPEVYRGSGITDPAHYCQVCHGWYGVPHDGIHPDHPRGLKTAQWCACRPCRDLVAASTVNDKPRDSDPIERARAAYLAGDWDALEHALGINVDLGAGAQSVPIAEIARLTRSTE